MRYCSVEKLVKLFPKINFRLNETKFILVYNRLTSPDSVDCDFPLFLKSRWLTHLKLLHVNFMHLHSQWVEIHFMAKNLVYKSYRNPLRETDAGKMRNPNALYSCALPYKECCIFLIIYQFYMEGIIFSSMCIEPRCSQVLLMVSSWLPAIFINYSNFIKRKKK